MMTALAAPRPAAGSERTLADGGAHAPAVEAGPATPYPPETDLDPSSRRWTVHVDNDLFAFGDRDRDYTAGVAFTLTGERARRHRWSPSRLLDRADALSGFERGRASAAPRGEALEFGLLLFTPQDLAAQAPLPDDRPYANLLYAASSKLALDEPRRAAFQSTLALGVLGLPLAEQIHRAIHEVVGSEEPRGYAHQISAGGEPTFMYSATRYRLLASGALRGGRAYSLRGGAGGSVGYVTEANAEIAFRTGAQWWESSPAAADYAGHPQAGGSIAARHGSDRPRLELEAGLRMRARIYNAFLEGQFRSSDVTFSSSELEPLLLDLWVGATTVFPNGLSVTYAAHRQTEEIKERRGGRAFTWASIAIAQRF
jgi:hypothetical protein